MKNIIIINFLRKTVIASAIIIVITVITFIFPSPVFAQNATLSLSPSSGTFNKACPFSLQINLNTAGVQTDGTDAILIYDTARFSATSISAGSIYADYPGSSIDEQVGKITISGLASVTTPFSGQGILATVNFKVKDEAQAGATQVKFDFDPQDKAKTTDSNVVERGTVADILNSVVNGNYVVGTGTCVVPSPSPRAVGAPGVPATPSGAVTPPRTLDEAVGGKPGTPELTYTLAIVGMVLTILGILGLAVL